MTEAELIRKADIALSDLAGSGLMAPDQSDRFYRKIMNSTAILQDARMVRMTKNKMELNRIGLGTRILRAANQGTISSPRAGEEGTRALARADRYRPTTDKIDLITSEVIAEIDLPYEILEDVIEGGGIEGTQFQQTILDLTAQRIALDLEELIVLGDTSSGDNYLALQDGVMKRAISNIVNQGGDPMDPQLFANMIKALPERYHNLLPSMRLYLSKMKEIDYRMTIAQRQTQLGDSILSGNGPVSALGIPMKPASYLPTSAALLMNPQNLIIGVQRGVRMEWDKDTRERVLFLVITMRLGMAFEEEETVVKAINIG